VSPLRHIIRKLQNLQESCDWWSNDKFVQGSLKKDFDHLLFLPTVLSDIVISYCVSPLPDWLHQNLKTFRLESIRLYTRLYEVHSPLALELDVQSSLTVLELELHKLIKTNIDFETLYREESPNDFTIVTDVKTGKYSTEDPLRLLKGWHRDVGKWSGSPALQSLDF